MQLTLAVTDRLDVALLEQLLTNSHITNICISDSPVLSNFQQLYWFQPILSCSLSSYLSLALMLNLASCVWSILCRAPLLVSANLASLLVPWSILYLTLLLMLPRRMHACSWCYFMISTFFASISASLPIYLSFPVKHSSMFFRPAVYTAVLRWSSHQYSNSFRCGNYFNSILIELIMHKSIIIL